MKKILFLAFALMLSAFTFAQQQLAILNHNNEITAFYGADAFINAHSQAENGDVITLSSGVFNAGNITKAITIRGAGAWADTTGGATMLRNNFTIDIPEDSIDHLTIEGIYFYNSVYCFHVYNPQFIKCYFQWIGLTYNNSSMRLNNAYFINCILAYWSSFGIYYSYYGYGVACSGVQFVNSVVMECNNYGTNDSYVNCVVRQHPENAASRMFQNCVLYYDYPGTNTPSNNSSTSYNCLYVQLNADSANTSELYAPMASHVLWNKQGMNTVFKTFNGSTEGETFELLPNIASDYLGTDGTQIGIYGGAMPFDPHVTSPLIKRINVANRSTADGKLEVDIEVVNE